MRHLAGRFIVCLALLVAGVSAPAEACSVVDSYRVPTNLELVEQADTILLAVVESGAAAPRRISEAEIVLRPTLLLKGETLPAELRFRGMSLAPAHLSGLSDPNELEQAHPLAYSGGCTRYMFVQGSTVLFFLQRHEGELAPLGAPFARSAEDVPSENARWVRAVRLYIEVARLPEGERRSALQARQRELAAMTDDPDAQAIAEDIGRQLRGPNRAWNAIMDDEISGFDAQQD